MGEKSAVRILTALLEGEQSAVEAYKSVAQLVPDTGIGAELQELAAAHGRRMRKLRRRLRQLGTTDGAGRSADGFVFPAFDSAVSDDLVALTLLRDGEERAMSAYQSCLMALDQTSRSFVMHDLIPEQELTDNVVATLTDGLRWLGRKSA